MSERAPCLLAQNNNMLCGMRIFHLSQQLATLLKWKQKCTHCRKGRRSALPRTHPWCIFWLSSFNRLLACKVPWAVLAVWEAHAGCRSMEWFLLTWSLVSQRSVHGPCVCADVLFLGGRILILITAGERDIICSWVVPLLPTSGLWEGQLPSSDVASL